ncbi:hypothetical protein [Wenzhouxiangella sp. EGI_FJ10409]|uniref:hypothetical protein n=1 Tax=Wenzhouxiangella sp. EGI_FJ10409 TaxID=3243767 RepID=UPI0035D5505C
MATAEPWVIVVSEAPSEPGSREMLELVLAGATLEVEMVVVFEGEGLGHLEPEPFAPWRQLIDFDLAGLRARQPASTLMPAGVSAVSRPAFEALCREAAGVLRL